MCSLLTDTFSQQCKKVSATACRQVNNNGSHLQFSGLPMPAPHFHLRPTVVATLLALNAVAALAQTTAAEPASSSGTLNTITVEASADASAEGLAKPYAGGQVARGGRVGILGTQDVMSTPFSTTSYTNELIQNQQARSVGDVLQNDPTVRIARGFGNFQESYFIRGFIVNSDDVGYNGLYGCCRASTSLPNSSSGWKCCAAPAPF
jgi:iron complex outermembrane receptor protein